MKAIDYKKFSGKKRNFIGIDRIWIGPDHLLIVESTGISERYKRFFFKDIQAIRLLKTKTTIAKIIYIATLFLVVGFLGAWAWNSSAQEVAVFPIIACLVLLYYLIRLFIQGPSCECWIYSSVQKEKIKPVTKVKTGKKLLGLLVPKIEALQGPLPVEKIRKERITAKPSAMLRHVPQTPLKKISKVWHRMLFLLLMIHGVFLALTLLFHPPVMLITIGVLGLVVLLLSTIAVVRQAGSDISRRIKAISITALVLLVLGSVSGYIEYMFFYMTNVETWARASHNQWEVIKLISEINYFDYPILLGKEIVLILMYFCLGAAGLISLWKQEK